MTLKNLKEIKATSPKGLKKEIRKEATKWIERFKNKQGTLSVKLKEEIGKKREGKEMCENYQELFNYDFNLQTTVNFLETFFNLKRGKKE